MKYVWGNLYWPYYLILASLMFAVPEGIAIATRQWADTLSDYSRAQLHVGVGFANNGVHTVAWWASIIVWLVFVVWITIHIWLVKLG